MRTLQWSILIVGCILLFGCTPEKSWKDVIYVAGGTATVEEVDFERVGDQSIEYNYYIYPPYSKNIGSCQTGSYLYISVINDGTGGYVTAEIDIDGVAVKTVTDPQIATISMTM
jgi:hypothetical protein